MVPFEKGGFVFWKGLPRLSGVLIMFSMTWEILTWVLDVK